MAALQEVNIDAAVASVKSETEFSQMGKKANHGTKSFSWWKGVFDLLQQERGTFLQPTVRSGRFVESPAEYLSLSTFCLNATLNYWSARLHQTWGWYRSCVFRKMSNNSCNSNNGKELRMQTNCSWAHVLISIIQSCVSQSLFQRCSSYKQLWYQFITRCTIFSVQLLPSNSWQASIYKNQWSWQSRRISKRSHSVLFMLCTASQSTQESGLSLPYRRGSDMNLVYFP